MRLTSTNEFESIKEIILLFLNSHQDYKMNKKMVKFMLVFDTESLSVNDIHLCHLKIKIRLFVIV